MPREARIDYPGALHHIMVRGMERRKLFKDSKDRQSFLERLGLVLTETQTRCFAFALMPNHIHLLLETGAASISRVMQSLLTGYARCFNLRHHRSGKLYQNRFKSVLCSKEDYLCELLRYIHLNPLRAGLVSSLSALDSYAWTGHAVVMGKHKATWLDVREALSRFGSSLKAARKSYRQFLCDGLEGPQSEIDFSGGGLIRSMGGVWEAIKATREGDKEASDERILGMGDFVETALRQANEHEDRASRLKRAGWDLASILSHTARTIGLAAEDLMVRGRANNRSQGRALFCKWMVVDLKESQINVANYLGISRPGVSLLVNQGRSVEREWDAELPDSP